jgi:predicted nucleotidyltransferase
VTTVGLLRQALEAQHAITLAVLFGSAAREESRPSSDLDVGVLGVAPAGLNSLELVLSRATGRRVDLVALETAPPLLRFEIARDGVVLLERTPHAWSDYRARAMVTWWDWAPTARLFQRAAADRLRVTHGQA